MATRRGSPSDTQILLSAILVPYRAKRHAILHRAIDMGLGASYARLSEKTGINPRTLSRIMNTGRAVQPGTMKLLADALDCPIADLFERVDPPVIRAVESGSGE